ncbi:MAG TPA: hypothetical protein VMS21_11960, partial [Methylomirabilota bacterium]|nr:hypothetical protein [Methylomirabilota bacterium]
MVADEGITVGIGIGIVSLLSLAGRTPQLITQKSEFITPHSSPIPMIPVSGDGLVSGSMLRWRNREWT